MAERVGSLIINLALESGAFKSGLTQAQRELRTATRNMEAMGKSMQEVGKALTASVTAPLAAAGLGIVKASADFESGMNRIQIATQATSGELAQMSDIALQIGKDTTFGATDAANAMEMLAKAGIDTKTIIGGAAKAVTDLAAAAGSELDPAASAISDSINQFKLSASELPMIVNQITGAVNESKFDFADFTYGMAQGGGVAASAGLSFKDFAATLAATSSQFASGADAGTSLKTFLLSMTPTTKKAAAAMDEYGLSFFDAAGKMRPMAEIAQMLQDKFGGLSDEVRNSALKEIFGTDAIRTAVGLMQQGAAGIDNISGKLAGTNAADQAAARMKGFNGQLEQLKGSLETLAIKIGQAGILDAVTGMVTGLAGLIDRISEASPAALQFGTVLAGIAAAAGPVTYVLGSLVKLTAPFTAALSLIAGEGGVLLAVQSGFAGLSAVLVPFLPLIAGVAAAGAFLYATWDKIGPALAEVGGAIQEAIGPTVTELINTAKEAFGDLMGSEFMAEAKQFVAMLGDIAAGLIRALGPAVVGVVKAAGALIAGVFHVIVDAIKLVGAVLSGDWAGAWQAAKDLVRHAVEGIGKAAEALLTGVLGSMARLVTGVKDWLVGKLTAVWDWVIGKLKLVGKAFYDLYDAVVGHSYVPDMVDGIAAQMARLDDVMVNPAKSATARTKQAFKQLQQDVQGLMADLFPEARDLADFRKKLATFDKAIASGKPVGGYTTEQLRAGRDRLLSNRAAPAVSRAVSGISGSLGQVATDGGDAVTSALDKLREAANDNAKKIGVANVRIAKSFKDMATESMNAIRDLADAVKGGDFFDILNSLIGIGLQLGSYGLFGKGIQTKLNSTPGFANGTSFAPGGLSLVGERGPELVNLPRGAQVIPNHALKGAGGGNTYYIQGNLLTPEFWGMIQAGDIAAARAGAAGGAQRVFARQSRRVA